MMNPTMKNIAPKAPRWISTEAGIWAWNVNEEWRGSADQALSVADRRRLLDQAERMHEHEAQAEV
jgi:hypothetical protein